MALAAKYRQFLANPTSADLADAATINYIPTLTTIHEPAAIVKHLSAQAKVLTKKTEKVISAIESANGLCVDVETVIEFRTSGGAYLPGLDDNFLSDRVVTLPVVHIVQFDPDHKIAHIRLYWDQGSLLKQVDVIGARARNWPIRDGRDQLRLISSHASTAPADAAAAPPPSSAPSSRPGTGRPHSSSTTSTGTNTTSATRDRHATLSLFETRDDDAEARTPRGRAGSSVSSVAPRASARPPPRDYSELFAGGDDDNDANFGDVASPSASGSKMTSPERGRHNGSYVPGKTGAGKHFVPNRLFDDDEETSKSPERAFKTNPKKYDHFEFGEGEDTPRLPAPAELQRQAIKASKHTSQWDFEDFTTPDKPPMRVRSQDVRHFGWSDDELPHNQDQGSPVRRPVVHHPRPDATTHFDFVDDGGSATPANHGRLSANPAVGFKGRMHNAGLQLYKDHVIGEQEDSDSDADAAKAAAAGAGAGPDAVRPPKKPLHSLSANVDNAHRRKDFGHQFEMTDASPGRAAGGEGAAGAAGAENGRRARKALEASWHMYDESPERGAGSGAAGDRKENIKVGGNGMGGRKDTVRSWGFGDEDGGVEQGRESGAQGANGQSYGRKAQQHEGGKGFWDF
ncbi:hypothetical protein BDY21DRAFT_316858 [Lineolata rhizophorae]|uniref:Uncharacterized protein n=1 Tax=Lineolata rhizophorae TaxID=578093 RepID=A0A6A6P7Q8_9PEZI|nr:hypothetical protein BDY21DRAFT_316858 [Lineolata rhizophorae]